MPALCALALFLNWLPTASGQADFSLQATAFNTPAMNPGGTALSTLTLSPLNGFSGTVTLTCLVTPATSTAPGCIISPGQVTPPATASLTATGTNPTSGLTATPGTYTVTVTGNGSTGTTHQQALAITVLAVAPGYTITVQTGVVPSSVHAGSGGQAILNVNPLNGYTTSGTSKSDGVWLTCSTITPLVTIPPVCSFNPQPVQVVGGVTSTTLTINTIAPPPPGSTSLRRAGWVYALWLPLPMLAVVGIGAAGNRRARTGWGLMALFVLAGFLLLLPACGSNTSFTTNTTTNVTTPKNTYTFTITGIDSNGVVSTNTSSNSAGPTVTLTVD